jgi:hypothetical protein
MATSIKVSAGCCYHRTPARQSKRSLESSRRDLTTHAVPDDDVWSSIFMPELSRRIRSLRKVSVHLEDQDDAEDDPATARCASPRQLARKRSWEAQQPLYGHETTFVACVQQKWAVYRHWSTVSPGMTSRCAGQPYTAHWAVKHLGASGQCGHLDAAPCTPHWFLQAPTNQLPRPVQPLARHQTGIAAVALGQAGCRAR